MGQKTSFYQVFGQRGEKKNRGLGVFAFKFITKITFLPTNNKQQGSNNLPLKICYKNIVNIIFCQRILNQVES